MPLVEIPEIGQVQFPDEMDDDAISDAILKMTTHPELQVPKEGTPFDTIPTTPPVAPATSSEELAMRNFQQGAQYGLGTRVPHERGPEKALDPLISVPRMEFPLMPGQSLPIPAKVGQGVYNFSAGTLEGLTSPAAIASLGLGAMAPAMVRPLSAGWSALMASKTPEAIQAAKESVEQGEDLSQQVEKVMGAVGTPAFAILAGKHALTRQVPKYTPPPQKPQLAKVEGGMRTREGLQKGRQARGETGAVFPEGDEGMFDPVELGRQARLEQEARVKGEVKGNVPKKLGQESKADVALSIIRAGEKRVADVKLYREIQAKIKQKVERGEVSDPEMKRLLGENEIVKNRYGGMPPTMPGEGSIGQGIKSAIERNKQSGSAINLVQSLKKKYERLREELRSRGVVTEETTPEQAKKNFDFLGQVNKMRTYDELVESVKIRLAELADKDPQWAYGLRKASGNVQLPKGPSGQVTDFADRFFTMIKDSWLSPSPLSFNDPKHSLYAFKKSKPQIFWYLRKVLTDPVIQEIGHEATLSYESTLLNRLFPRVRAIQEKFEHEAGETLTPKYLFDHWDKYRADVTQLDPAVAHVIDFLRYREGMVETPRMSPQEIYKKDLTKLNNLKAKIDELESSQGTIGSGIKSALEQNKEQGVVLNPFAGFNRPHTGPVAQRQRLGRYAEEKAVANKAVGLGTLPSLGKVTIKGKTHHFDLGRLFDKRGGEGVARTPQDEAINAYHSQIDKSRKLAALWSETRKGVERPFETDKTGQVTLAGNRKGYVSDVIRSEMLKSGSQALTTKQRAFVKDWQKQWDAERQAAMREGLKSFRDESGQRIPLSQKAYFPRSMKEVRPGHLKLYRTEAAGVRAGVIHEPDVFSRISSTFRAVDRAIILRRLARDPAMAGRKGAPIFVDERTTAHPAFRGKVFPERVAKQLDAIYEDRIPTWLKVVEKSNNLLKGVQFTIDASTPLNQGLTVLGSNPVRWAKATLRHYASFVDERALQRYITRNQASVNLAQEFVKNGGSLGRPSDYFAGVTEGSVLEKIPPIRASSRAMTTFLSVAKLELFESMKPLAQRKGWSIPILVEAIENMVGNAKTEAVGLTHGRIVGEQLLLNAPTYIRAYGNLVTMIKNPGPERYVARRALVGLGTALLIQQMGWMAYKYSQGEMSEEEVFKRLNPENSEFMRIPLDLDSDERLEVSYSNLMLALLRTLGDTVEIARKEDKELGVGRANPAIKFGMARTSPIVKAAGQVAYGQDYRGEDIGLLETARQTITPIGLEALFDEEGSKKSKLTQTAIQELGLGVHPESYGAERRRKFDLAAREKGFEDYGLTPTRERLKISRQVEPKIQERRGQKLSAGQLAQVEQQSQRNAERVQSLLSNDVQSKLKDLGLSVPPFNMSKTYKGATIRLTEEEMQRFRKIQVEETQRELSKFLIQNRRLDGVDYQRKKMRFSRVMEVVHRKSWGRMIKEIEGKAKGK